MTAITRRTLLQGTAMAGAAISAAPAAKAANAAPAPVGKLPRAEARERLLFDFGWRFAFGHAGDPSKDFGFGRDQETFAKSGMDVSAAAALDFDDSGWTPIDLPHDWAVTLPCVPTANPPKDDPRAGHGFKPLGRDFPATSIGWYRRIFDLPASDSSRRLSLEFDGVFRDCLVMVNGFAIGNNGSGYAPFRVDISDYANYGGKNVIAVRVDATLGEGWFYEGAGIYRHVWLVKTDPLHIPQWGVCVRSSLAGSAASLAVETELANESGTSRACRVISTIFDENGRLVARTESPPTTIGVNGHNSVSQNARISNASLWSPDSPHLYWLLTQVLADGRVADDTVMRFGIRTTHFDSEKGFFLNGKPLKLKGTCNHQDFAGVGSALPDRLHDFRIRKLKEMGSNAYRCAHNPPAPELLEACDSLGMLVIDETRRMAADAEGVSELTRMIRRDRNHPSIILWSIGNEEHALQGTELGARVAAAMRHRVLELDPTRPITAAIDDPNAWGIGITPALDVMGANYRTDGLAGFHARKPGLPLVCTEIASGVATRGVYVRDPASGYVVAYDTEAPPWGCTQEAAWNLVGTETFLSGGFVWSGFDYRGEPTPQTTFPNNSSQFGLMDSCGFPKDDYFYYRAWWRDEPALHLFPHWNWQGREGQKINVWCHSNLERVELFLNGASLGMREVVPLKHVEWDVPYAPGVLEARGYGGGRLVLTEKRETAGAPAAIALRADRFKINADGEDVAVVSAQIVDAQGRLVPTAANLVTFDVSGPGRIVGVGNGDPRCLEPDKAIRRSAFNGLCLAIVQASKGPGTITLHAASPGLEPATLAIDAQLAELRPRVA
jgi:beta-galactosidase